MRSKLFAMLGIVALLASLRVVPPVAGQDREIGPAPIAVEISHRLKTIPAPPQPSPAQAAATAAAGSTTASQCGGDSVAKVITLNSFDPAHPGSQDVVFWRETPAGVEAKVNLWVAWDFLSTGSGHQDVISCDKIAGLQSRLDGILATDVTYFGDYRPRPDGTAALDVMVYSIMDEGYFSPDFPFNVGGFFWPSLNRALDKNVVFLDSYDWSGRLGPDAPRPNEYEAMFAHTVEHLIHDDHDADEPPWVDEGLADLAAFLNGFGHPDPAVVYYLAHHRTSLTVWDGSLESQGAAYLFQLYLLENFGRRDGGWDPAWTRAITNEGLNSIAGVQARTGRRFNELYDAWVLANSLDRPDLRTMSGLLLGYREIDLAPFVSREFSPWSIQRAIAESYGAQHRSSLPVSRLYGGYQVATSEPGSGSLPPYAPYYTSYRNQEPALSVRLRGDMVSGVAPHSGSLQMASGAGNLLTDRRLRLTVPVGGTLSFWTWFEMERDWDYGFVEVSTDGGAGWTATPGTVTGLNTNPNSSTSWRNSLVGGQASSSAAITGSSGGWVRASFALPAAANVLVRFSYYTDEAVNGRGWFIDDLSVDGAADTVPPPAAGLALGPSAVAGAGLSDGFESGGTTWALGGWQLTTGLFANDWAAAFASPVYGQARLPWVEVGAFDRNDTGGLSEWEMGLVDTSQLNQDAVVVVVSNRPGESPFAGSYGLTVEPSIPVATPVSTPSRFPAPSATSLSPASPFRTPAVSPTSTAPPSPMPTAPTAVSPTPKPTSAPDSGPGDSGDGAPASPTPVSAAGQ